jgi:hypothetical protein
VCAWWWLIGVEIDNVAEAKYGTGHWDAYVFFFSIRFCRRIIFYREMSKKSGDDEITWGRK